MIALLLGCASTSGLGTARTIDQHDVQYVIAQEGGWVQSHPLQTPLVRQDVGVRYGITDDLEVGATIGGWAFIAYWSHVQYDLKYQLHSGPRLDVAVDAAVAHDWFSVGKTYGQAATVQVPLLVGIRTKRDHEWVLTPRLVYQHTWSKGSAPVDKLLVGQSVGFAWHTGPLTIYPNVGVLWSTNPADAAGGMRVLQYGVGFYWPE